MATIYVTTKYVSDEVPEKVLREFFACMLGLASVTMIRKALKK